MTGKKRKNTRNKVWPETEVHVSFRNKAELKANNLVKFRADVGNLGSSGIFIKTDEHINTGTEVDLKVDFQPGAHPPIFIHATGRVVRIEKSGFAVSFTDIDVKKLGECIMAKLNSN